MQHVLRSLLLAGLAAGCPDPAGVADDAFDPPSCADTSAAPTVLAELYAEPCELVGFTASSPRELAAAADGSLYVIVDDGRIERYVGQPAGCRFARDATFASPSIIAASIEATADGRLYATSRDGTGSRLTWLGTDAGACTSSRAYRPEIAASGDGSVVLAPATGPGLYLVETTSCTESPLLFVTDTPRLFGRAGDDVVFGGPTGVGVGRFTIDGTEVYRITSRAFAGRDGSALELLGTRVASWGLGRLFSVDAATGAQVPTIDHEEFFAAATTEAEAQRALFDVAPDGRAAFVLAVAPGTGACAVTPSLHRLSVR